MLDQAVNWLISLESWLATRAILGASHMNLGGGKGARRAVKSAKIARYRVISHIIAKYRGDDIVKGYGQGRDHTCNFMAQALTETLRGHG